MSPYIVFLLKEINDDTFILEGFQDVLLMIYIKSLIKISINMIVLKTLSK